MLTNDSFHHLTTHIRKSKISALVAVGEAFVVDAELVEDGGTEVVGIDGVFHHVVAIIVGFAISCSALEASASDPE